MRQRFYIIIAPILLLIAFLGFNFGAERFLSGVSFDATQDRLFTLSSVTKNTIAQTDGTIVFDFYFSKQSANENPPLRLYGTRVRDVLKSYSRFSKGKIIFREHDAAPFSAAEDNAIAANLNPWRDSIGAVPPIYLGLVASKDNQSAISISAFMPEKEASLEYDITRLINNLNHPKNRIIGVISDLDWFFSAGPSGLRSLPNSQIAKEIALEYEVLMLARDFDRLPPKMDTLLIAQPFDLSEFQQYLLDQYVVNGGHILLAQDPASSISHDNKVGRSSSISALGRLSTAWGFSLSGAIVADKKNALLVQSKLGGRDTFVPQPLYFSINDSGLNKNHLITASLMRGVNIATPGQIRAELKRGIVFEPLLITSKDTMLLDKATALNSPTPQEIISMWDSDGESQIVGASIRGAISSAFPNGPPAVPPRSQTNTQIFGSPLILPPHMNISKNAANIIVISDVDFLSDGLFIQSDTTSADNANFALNAIDFLSGTSGLADLRSRVKTPRTLKAIDTIGVSAQANALENQTHLESQLRNLQAQLQEIEELEPKSNKLEKTQLRKEIAQTRYELRSISGAKLKKISQIKNLILLVCAFILPLIILAIGFYFNRKSRYFNSSPNQN